MHGAAAAKVPQQQQQPQQQQPQEQGNAHNEPATQMQQAEKDAQKEALPQSAGSGDDSDVGQAKVGLDEGTGSDTGAVNKTVPPPPKGHAADEAPPPTPKLLTGTPKPSVTHKFAKVLGGSPAAVLRRAIETVVDLTEAEEEAEDEEQPSDSRA